MNGIVFLTAPILPTFRQTAAIPTIQPSWLPGMSEFPSFLAHIRRQFRSLYQDADGTMQCFVWHKDHKAVCHCLAAILNLADDSNKDASS